VTTIAKLAVQLVADTSGYSKGLLDAQNKTSAFSKGVLGNLNTVGSGILGGTLAVLKSAVVATTAIAAAGAIAATKFLYDSVQAAAEAQKVQAQLNAVLESTGGIAGITAEEVNALADSLSRVTPFEDEMILSGQNMLLTFTNIGENVFPQATETILDMSQALGQDLKSSAIQLGKALQDPIEGVTALRRVGVNFTDEQKNMIEALVKSGKLEEAQTFILKELQTEFGGSARAAGQTFAGQLEILKNGLGNVKETIGGPLLGVLGNLVQMLNEKLANPKVQAFITDLSNRIADFANLVIVTFQKISQNGFMDLFTVYEDGSSIIGNLLQIFGMSETAAQEWAIKIRDAVRNIQIGFQQAFAWLAENRAVVVAALTAIGVAIMVSVVTAIVSAVVAAAPLILTMLLIAGIAYVIYRAWTENWGGIQEKTAAVWAWLQNAFTVGVAFIKDLWASLQPAIQWVMTYISTLVKAWQAAFNGDWYKFGQLLRQAWDMAWKLITNVVSNAWAGIKAALSTLATNAENHFKGIDWEQLGSSIIDGIVNGINNGIALVAQTAKAVAEAALSAAMGFLGIDSPSKVFEMQVGWQMAAGTAKGWEQGLNKMLQPSLGLLTPAMATVPGIGGGGGGTGGGNVININVSLQTMGLFDEREAARRIAPAVRTALREYGI
jgi:hypothetical protein